MSVRDAERKMLLEAGYGEPAVNYYLEKKYLGFFDDADHTYKKIGSCGDIMKIYLKIDSNTIKDIRYEITGCAGAISAAMATVDLVRGKNLDDALKIDDGDVFNVLESIPEKKNHCIQLAVKTMHEGIREYQDNSRA